jgi:hypothetical protein
MLAIALLVPLLATSVSAICPGFNFAIGDGIGEGGGFTRCASVAFIGQMVILIQLQTMFTTTVATSLTV